MIAESCDKYKPPNYLPKWLYYFAFPPTMNESSCCSTSLTVFDVISVPDFGHCKRYVWVSHCGFNLHFSDDVWCGQSFSRAYLPSLVNCLLRSLAQFLIGLFAFLLLSFKSSLCTLDTVLYLMCLLQVFSSILWFVFSLS